MLNLYTNLYAWAYILNERQWGKGHDHDWAALINTSILLLLNLGTLAVIPCAIGHFDVGRFLERNSTGASITIVGGVPLLIWFFIQRTGRGPRLVERLRDASSIEKRQMERKLIGYLATSLIVCTLSWVGFALLR